MEDIQKCRFKWLKRFVKDDSVMWCDNTGKPFQTETFLKKAKYSGDAYVKAKAKKGKSDFLLLPTAFELTEDDKWQKEGSLWQLYDLKLNEAEKVLAPVDTGLTPSKWGK